MRRATLPYMPGLDGLRAIAVIAVVLYHSRDVTGIANVLKPTGGFLGVEVFFVISGFLITALLLREHETKATISLREFWTRRARRLLPALYVFLAGTTLLAALFATDALDKIKNEILGAIFYVSNWLLIATDESYFEAAGRPSLFRHLWSLAIEEQFYLVWPLVVFAALRLGGRRLLLAFTALAVVGSTALLWVLFDGVPRNGDVSSVYYRTDARAAALLLGSMLAMVWQPWKESSVAAAVAASRPGRWVIDLLGVASLGVVVLMNYGFTDDRSNWGSYQRLYHGGFLALSAATIVVIAAVSLPGSRLGWALSNPVARWIGTRSYGIYLWHWPVFQLTRPRLDVDMNGYALLAVRLALTVALVEGSYRAVEAPVRERRFVRTALASLRTPRGIGLATAWGLAAIVGTAAVALAIPTIDRSPTTTTEVVQVAADDALTATAATPPPTLTPEPTTLAVGESAATAPLAPQPGSAADLVIGDFDAEDSQRQLVVPTPTQPPLPPPLPLSEPFDITASRIHIVGDSVIEGAQGQLYRISPQVTIDGRIGRQWWELEGELRQMRAQGLANDVVIIQLGNNGNFNSQMFDGVMRALEGTRLVIFINIHAPVVWEADVNATLARNVNRYAEQARLIDWYTAAADHPEYFIEDGTHLQGPGQVAFRSLIENTLLSLG